MMLNMITAYPAYGRDPKIPDEVDILWDEGKDFSPYATGGSYFSNRDIRHFREEGYEGITFMTRSGKVICQRQFN